MQYIFTIGLMLLSTVLIAQTNERTFQLTNGKTDLTITTDYSDVEIKTIQTDQFRVKGSFYLNGFPVEQGIEYHWDQQKHMLDITVIIDELRKKSKEELEEYLEQLDCDPEVLDRIKKWIGHRNHHNFNIDAVVEIEVPQAIDELKVKATYGSVELESDAPVMDVHSVYGSVTAAAGSQIARYDLFSTYSEVDLTLPDGYGSGVMLESHYGDIYTDFDVKINQSKSVDEQFKQRIVGSLNEGGSPAIALKSNYSNVYLRKG